MSFENVTFQVEKATFPSIYIPRPVPFFVGDDRPWYSINVRIVDIPEELKKLCHSWIRNAEDRGDSINIRSIQPPRVKEIEGRYADLKALYEMADMQNVPRDFLLRDLPMGITTSPYEVENQHGKRVQLGLAGLVVSVRDMDLNLNA